MKNNPTIIVGVDPGINGALAFLDVHKHEFTLHQMPIFNIRPGAKTKKVLDHVQLGLLLDNPHIVHLYLEQVNAMPGQGAVSTFSFGRHFGTVFGACGALNIPLTEVRPAAWKKVLKVPADKDAARFRASQLFPKCAPAWPNKSDDGLAEAALIAFYGMCDMGFSVQRQFDLSQ